MTDASAPAVLATALPWKVSRRRLIPSMLIGTFIEWYDMFIYTQGAALIFPHLFFPAFSPAAGTLAAFATFGVGYLARPVGAVLFGHVGDRFGRRTSLIFTLVLMGASTALVGLLPTFQQIGVLAPALLVVLRLLQGLGAGAEYSGSFVLVAESAPRSRRGFWSAFPGIGVYLGQGTAAVAGATVFALPLSAAESFAWRIPYFVSALLVVLGLIVRLKLQESPVFRQLESITAARKTPFVQVFLHSKKRLAMALVLTAPIAFNGYVTTTYGITYSVQHGTSTANVLIGSIIGAYVAIITVPIAGWLSDRFGRRPVYLVLSLCSGASAFPYFALLSSGKAPLLWIAMVAIVAPFIYSLTGGQAALLAELFPAEYRYSGVALSRELSTALLTAFCPIIALGLVELNGGSPWILCASMALIGVLTAIVVFLLPETRAREMGPGAAETAPPDLVAEAQASAAPTMAVLR
ncbi:MAG TPA: MFS transporter [Gryllotalpicola sp.]